MPEPRVRRGVRGVRDLRRALRRVAGAGPRLPRRGHARPLRPGCPPHPLTFARAVLDLLGNPVSLNMPNGQRVWRPTAECRSESGSRAGPMRRRATMARPFMRDAHVMRVCSPQEALTWLRSRAEFSFAICQCDWGSPFVIELVEALEERCASGRMRYALLLVESTARSRIGVFLRKVSDLWGRVRTDGVSRASSRRRHASGTARHGDATPGGRRL